MKLRWTASIAVALAAGVTPVAFAEEAQTVDAAAFARAGLTPIALESPRYPIRAEKLLEEGVCTVRFDIAADGAVENAEPTACTSWNFEREAMRVVSALRYPAREGAQVIRDQEVTFRWLGRTTEE
jgi:TonB family protein